MKIKRIFQYFKNAFSDWSEDNSAMLAAALSFYTFFSLTPLLILMTNIAGMVFGQDAVQSAIIGEISRLVGNEGGQAIKELLSKSQQSRSGFVSTVISSITLVIGAIAVFAQLQTALNIIWKAPQQTKKGIWGFIRKYFLSFGIVVSSGFLLLVSLIISAGLSALNKYFSGLILGIDLLLKILGHLLSFIIITILFALIFKILPNIKIKWKSIWMGAAFTSFLFIIGQVFIGIYLGKSNLGDSYGAATSLVIILLWIYYSSQILFFGVEFTKQFERKVNRK
ncbi:MAG: YihY/virulence factor BrkB family protein [Oligoflexia bacterium]|nr:YihY/virulence factor BrkB family protein [Oligoflexia bacterium]